MAKETVCRVKLPDQQYLMIHAKTTQSESTKQEDPPTSNATCPANSDENFEMQIQQILQEADAMDNEENRQTLYQVILKYKDYFAKDTLDWI